MSLRGDLTDAWHDLIVGGRCVGCRRPGRLLCRDCHAELPQTARSSPPTPAPPGIVPAFAAGPYEGTLKQLVIGLKEHQLLGLRRPLAGLLAPLPRGRSVHYAKHMAHHLDLEAEADWTDDFRNVLLIRDPREVVASYVRSREACEADDIGLLQEQWLLDRWDALGADVPVIDSADFLRDPETHLRWLCDWLGIPFTDRMLSWPPGPRESDGVWAPYWYDAVLASTGFEPRQAREVSLSDHDAAVAEACRSAYEAMRERRVRPL